MLGYDVEMSSIFRRILGPLVLGWVPNNFGLGTQLASGEKRLVCIPDLNIQDCLEKSLKIKFALKST